MKYLVSAAVLGALTSPVLAADKPIEGGFGVKLGNKIEQRLVESCRDDAEMTLCVFKPDVTSPVFDRYTVTLEPQESKIVGIEASRLLSDSCENIKQKLAQSYSKELHNFQEHPYLYGYGPYFASLTCKQVEQGFQLSFVIFDAEFESKAL